MPAVEDEPAISRSSERLSRETFKTLFNLSKVQPWLEHKQDALEALCDLSPDSDHLGLVLDLISRFLHLDSQKQSAAIESIVDQITKKWGCASQDSFIVASNNNRFSDSSENVLWLMKPKMPRNAGWSTVNFYSNMRDLVSKAPDGSNVIIVDEFIGTGESMFKVVKWFEDKLTKQGVKCSIRVCALASMEGCKSKLDSTGVEYFSAHWLNRGISDHFKGPPLVEAIHRMLAFEALLADKVDNLSLSKYKFGYKKTEALYCRDGGNACNNVFPLFWWPRLSSGTPRYTLLDRL